MQPVLIVFLLLLPLQTSARQEDNNNLADLIPAGFILRDTVSGDLNRDGIPDLILIAENPDSPERPFLVLIRDREGHLLPAAKNNYIILPREAGGAMDDPYTLTRIHDGCFTVEHFYGSRERTFTSQTFCYREQLKDWILVADLTQKEDAINAAATRAVNRKISRRKPVTFTQYRGSD